MKRDQFFEDLFDLGFAVGEPIIRTDDVFFVFRDDTFTVPSANLGLIKTNNDPWRVNKERRRVFDYMTARVSDLRKLRKLGKTEKAHG